MGPGPPNTLTLITFGGVIALDRHAVTFVIRISVERGEAHETSQLSPQARGNARRCFSATAGGVRTNAADAINIYV